MNPGEHSPIFNDSPSRSFPEAISANCTSCHMTDEARERDPAFFRMHTSMMQRHTTCLGCHADSGHHAELQGMKQLSSP
ncbi:NapC/NirT family cytochrome c [Ectothiorhodosinus mongolicus]|uniref:NapC/NirT family cytochrome c n=1 Tax=Ectothiorhodosinus mongolicus TaxID=233100 RepID=UPI0009785E14